MPWGNPIVGGQGVLIRDSIRSSDYVAGTSGWQISRDGSAEFNDIDVRGELFVTGADGSYISIEKTDGLTDLPYMRLFPRNPAGYPNRISAFIFADEFVAGDSNQLMGLTLGSPCVGSTSNSAGIKLVSSGQTSGANPSVVLFDDVLWGNGTDRYPIPHSQTGRRITSFAASVSQTFAVTFPTAFPSGVVPTVHCNIDSSDGSTRFWRVSAYNISNTGFTMWCATTDAARVAESWTNIPVQWRAFAD